MTGWALPRHETPELELAWWCSLLGRAGAVLEIGSGEGALARFLAVRGYRVTATEITPKRGQREPVDGVEWRATDGVRLSRIAGPNAYDAVIHWQVLEHRHPDDVPTHLAEACAVLRPGGRLIIATPQRHVGPADVSAALGCEIAEGMHLKEWAYHELVPLVAEAGFEDLRSVVLVPSQFRRLCNRAVASHCHLRWSLAIERWLERSPTRSLARKRALRYRYLGFRRDIMLSARKPG